jgi:hypothetical protein
MSVSTTTNLSNSLRRTYSPKYFKAFQDDFTPLLDELDECPDEPTEGEAWYFPFYLYSPQNRRVSEEGGGMGTVRQRSEIQGKVNVVEWLGWLQISELLKLAGAKKGAFNGSELNRQMKETTTDITKFRQRMYTISHGTGRLAVIQDNTSSANTFVAKNDEGVNALMEGDPIDVYDADSAGSSVITSRIITKINRQTRTVTFDGAAASLTADHGVYSAGDYGRGCNGFHGLIDNNVYQDVIHNQARSTYEKLKSQVRDPGTPTALTENAMYELCNDIYVAGGEVDSIQCSVGVMSEFFKIQRGDRRYNIERGQTAKMVLGHKEGDALFSYDKGTMVIKKNVNLPNRTMYFYSLKSSFYKHTLRKLGWLDEGGSLLRLTPTSDGFKTSWTALIYAAENISCYAPIWNGVLRNVADARAGDTVEA